jgi:predicted transcriptional regulator
VDSSNTCCGIITDRDICLQVILNGQDPKSTCLRNVMTRNVLTSKPEDDINRTLSQMENKQVKRIIVVDDNNRCVGIISESDIVQRLQDQGKISELTSAVYSK